MSLSESTSLVQNYKKIFNLPKLIIFCFKARFSLDSKWGHLTTFFGRQFPGFKCEHFRRHISSNIVRLKYQKFLIIIGKYHRSWWLILQNFRCYQKMPLIRQKLTCTKQFWWEPSLLKRNKLKIKIGGNKKYQQELFVPVHTTLASTFTDYILNWLCFVKLPANIPANIQNVGILKDIDQKN